MKFDPSAAQRLAIPWLIHHDQAALFAGMGLGKTASVLTAYVCMKLLGTSKGVLIVSPLRVTNLTWQNEANRWDHTKDLKVANLRTKEGWLSLLDGSADIYLINYESLPRLGQAYMKFQHDCLPFDTVVFDESTMAKNPSSKRINGFRKHIKHITRRWGLTGTPNPNSLLELYAQIRLLDEGKRFGPSADAFKRAYFHPIDYMEYDWRINGKDAEDKIYAKLSDIALVLKTEDYSDVPQPEITDVEVTLGDEARKHYDEMEKELLAMIGSGDSPVIAPNAAVLAGKLHQMTGGAVYREDKTVADFHTAKLDELRALITKLKKHEPNRTFLIACNYRHEQSRIAGALNQAVRFSDAESKADQDILFSRWNAGHIPYLVVDPRSVGHGLNLQSGGYTVIWYSVPWSNELYAQLNARLCRRGQSEQVEVYRLIAQNTIDDAVVETLRQRAEGVHELMTTLKNLWKLTHC